LERDGKIGGHYMTRERLLPDFLQAYSLYTANTESAKIFHEWVGISLISSVLRKKVKFKLGRLSVYPNLYIVLVAEPGKARKTVAMSYGVPLLKHIEDIKMSADSITREALLQDLERCAVDSPMPDGRLFKHSSLSIISPEFESFLGQKTDNAKMLVLLTDLFDCSEDPYKYRTKNSGDTIIPSVYLSILGATTPESLATAFPSAAIGGGLSSRILFIWADVKDKKVPIPEETEEIITLKSLLKNDLFTISQLAGVYDFTKEARDYWISWYNTYEDLDINRLCTDPSFNGWYSRKPMMVLKLGMILSASKSNETLITSQYLAEAIIKIEEAEVLMGNAFRSVGRSQFTGETDKVISIIKANKEIDEHSLMRMVWRDLDSVKFETVINTILSTGRVKKFVTGDKPTYIYVRD
jgi:hypothetical protein